MNTVALWSIVVILWVLCALCAWALMRINYNPDDKENLE